MTPQQKRNLTFKKIIDIVSKFYNVPLKDILSSKRKKNVAKARQIIAYLLREKLQKSYPAIGQELNNRDHTTIMYAYHKIKRELEKNENLKRDIESILNLISQGQKLETAGNQVVQIRTSEKKNTKWPFLVKSIDDLPKTELFPEQLFRQFDILEKYKEGWTLEEIGKKYNLSRERVRQIVKRGLIYDVREILKEGFILDLNEFLKEEKRKHLLAMKIKHGILKEQTSVSRKEKRWSRYYDCCRKCGTVVVPHHSHGYCKQCYPKTEIFKEMQKASYLRNIEKRKKYMREYSKRYYKKTKR